MNTCDIAKINHHALMWAESFKPNLLQYNNEKEFMELYNSGIAFCQVFYYDKSLNGTRERSNFNFDPKYNEEMKKAVKLYNEKLEVMQKKAIQFFGILDKVKGWTLEQIEQMVSQLDETKKINISLCSHDQRTYYNYASVGDDLGICHFRTFVRSESLDHTEEQNEHFETNNKKKSGPFGGAFASNQDYVDWREGKGFVKPF